MNKYTKNALIKSAKFKPMERDILKITLDDDRQYTIAEVKRIIRSFKGGI